MIEAAVVAADDEKSHESEEPIIYLWSEACDNTIGDAIVSITRVAAPVEEWHVFGGKCIVASSCSICHVLQQIRCATS